MLVTLSDFHQATFPHYTFDDFIYTAIEWMHGTAPDHILEHCFHFDDPADAERLCSLLDELDQETP